MKLLLINGSPNEFGCTYTALSEIEKTLHSHQIKTSILYLGKQAVAGCKACRHCFKTGYCIYDDAVNEVVDDLDNIAGIIVGSPVHYAAASGQITSFLDRLFYVASPKMAGKIGASIVSCRRAGATAAFDQLNKYFLISNMLLVGSNYWNQVHGHSPEEVAQDLEGLQTMRVLGENMAWVLKNLKAGQEAAIEKPVYEKRLMTNFIR